MNKLMELARAEKQVIDAELLADHRAREARCSAAKETFVDRLRTNAFPLGEVFDSDFRIDVKERMFGERHEHTVKLTVKVPGGRVEIESEWNWNNTVTTWIGAFATNNERLLRVPSSFKRARIDFLAALNVVADRHEDKERNRPF